MCNGNRTDRDESFGGVSPPLFLSFYFRFATQTTLFMEEVKQQLLFPQIRSYLKLYTTIGLEKIARFNNLSEEDFSAKLISMKHKLTQVKEPTEKGRGGQARGVLPRLLTVCHSRRWVAAVGARGRKG